MNFEKRVLVRRISDEKAKVEALTLLVKAMEQAGRIVKQAPDGDTFASEVADLEWKFRNHKKGAEEAVLAAENELFELEEQEAE